MKVYTTAAGVQIGLLYQAKAPAPQGDDVLLQSALLDTRTTRPRPWLLRLLGYLWELA